MLLLPILGSAPCRAGEFGAGSPELALEDAATSVPAWRRELPTQNGATVDIKLSNQPIENAVAILSEAANRTILLGDGVKGKQVTAFFKNTPIEQALRSFADAQQLCLVARRDCILLVTRQEYLNLFARTEIVPLKRANPDALAKVLLGSQKADLLTIAGEARTRSIVLRGDPEQIAAAREAALSLDRSLESRVFSIRYAAVNTIAKAIGDAMRLDKESIGTIVPDERSNRVIVSDSPENLAACENIITSLDVPVQTRVFSTGNIDPKIIGEQIKKGELGGADKGEKGARAAAPEATVQVVEGTNQIIVTDTPERLDNLEKVMAELNQNIITRIIQPKNGTAKQIAEVLKGAFANVTIATDPRTGSLIVTAHRSIIDQIEDLVKELDAEKNIQVEIESKIMLVATDKLKQYGMRIYGQDLDGLNETLANISVNPNFPADSIKPIGSTMGNPLDGPVKNPIKLTPNYLEVLQPNLQVQAIVRALVSDGDTKVLSNPRLQMLNGQTSQIFSGTSEPYHETTFQDSRSVENVKFKDVGITFEVTPVVSPNDELTLEVILEFSTLRAIRDGVPVVDIRKAQSIVEARNGETLMLGGLISEETAYQKSGIPVLRSIPGVGFFFGDKGRRMQQRELIIVITPKIVTKSPTVATTESNVPDAFKRIKQEFPDEQTQTTPAGPTPPQ